MAAVVRPRHFIRGKRQDGFEQSDARVANLELGRMNADRESAGTRRGVVPRQGALRALVEPALLVQRQRVSGNHEPALQLLANGGRNH